jgi:hypothetical protein
MRFLLYAIGPFVAFGLVLSVTDRHVLLQESKLDRGQTYELRGHGTVDAKNHETIVCYYFTGYSIDSTVLQYTPSNFPRPESCPFLRKIDVPK